MTDNEKQQRVKSIMQKLETAFFATFPGVNEKWTDRIEEGFRDAEKLAIDLLTEEGKAEPTEKKEE